MRKLILLPVLLSCLAVFSQRPWKQGLRYQLNAALDDATRKLTGTMELAYRNQSPDTLFFIWFHLWPNAFRDDRTRYSEQLLENGRTDFYFSDPEDRGYMNQMEFRIAGAVAGTEDHPEYPEVVKVFLPQALAPGDSVTIGVRFQVRLPANFSGLGYTGHHYEFRNWYPEPAVYDASGWHPAPFLAQGAGYHETADFDISLTLPAGFLPAAGNAPLARSPDPAGHGELWRFRLRQANGFAWAADRRFHFLADSVRLASGNILRLRLAYLRRDSVPLFRYLAEIKAGLRHLSPVLGDPGNPELTLTGSAGKSDETFSGILFVDPAAAGTNSGEPLLRQLTGLWLKTAGAPDLRERPWLALGLQEHYMRRFAGKPAGQRRWNDPDVWLAEAERGRTTQPVTTAAPDFSAANYALVARTKAGRWFDCLEKQVGRQVFDDSVRTRLAQGTAGDSLFFRRSPDGPGPSCPEPRVKPLPWLPLGRYNGHTYPLLPAVGYNRYDGFMAGLVWHDYRWPATAFQYLLAPLYATETKTIAGTGRLAYSWVPGKKIREVTLGINGSGFSTNRSTDSSGKQLAESVTKIVPYLRLRLRKSSPRSTVEKEVIFRSYLFREKSFSDYAVSAADELIHPNAVSEAFRYLNEVSFLLRDDRALYPYDGKLSLQQGAAFYRINLTARYRFTYASGGGLSVRFFAAKFGVWNRAYSGDLTRYEPKLLGVTGVEDYTYDEYFAGRSASYAFEKGPVYNGGFPAQQIYNRDGGLKLRIDPYDYVQGRSADWVAALNFNTTLPANLLPIPLPVRLFFDFGTYAEAWETGPQTSRFLYTGGVQLTLFREVLNIYAPLVYSSDFRDLIRSEGFGKRITFSLDLQALERTIKTRVSYHAEN